MIEKLEVNPKIKFLFALLALLLTVATIYFYSPLIVGADTVFHYNRLLLVMEALKNHTYPFYIDYETTNGYGYLMNTFYPDITLIPFAIIGIFTSLKTGFISLIVGAFLFTFFFTYKSVNNIFKNNFTAYLAAVLYTFCSFRLFDVFYRGAIAEYLAFTFIPLIVWGIYEISNGNFRKWYIFTIGCFLLLNTHLITTAIVSIFVSFYILINLKNYHKNKKRIKYLSISIVCTALLSIGFLIPFAEQILSNEFYFSTKPSTNIEYSLITMTKIFESIFNSVYSNTDIAPSPSIGGFISLLLLSRFLVKRKTKHLYIIDFCVLIGFVMIFSANHYFPWSYFPFKYFQFIQHPTRLLMMVSLIFAIAGSYYLTLSINGSKTKIYFSITILFIILLIVKANASNFYEVPKNKLENWVSPKLALGGAEYLPSKIGSVEDLWKRKRTLIYNKENIQIEDITIEKENIEFQIKDVLQSDFITIPYTYYKGYEVKENGQVIDYQQSEDGMLQIKADKQSDIFVSYIGTPLQKIANYTAFLLIFAFTIYVCIVNYKMKKNE